MTVSALSRERPHAASSPNGRGGDMKVEALRAAT